MVKTTSIHINGKHYDALTGALLSERGARKSPVKSIDGVVGGPRKHTAKQATRPKAAHPVATSAPVIKEAVQTHIAKPRPTREKARPRAQHATVKRSRPSTTLMRHTVKKPTPSTKAQIKVQSHLQSNVHASARPAHLAVISDFGPIKPKVGFHAVHAKRVERATKASASERVAHFAHELRTELPIAAEHAVKNIDAAIVIPKTIGPDVVAPKPRTTDVFEQALLRATSHQEPAPVTKKERKATRVLRRRMVSFGAGAVAVLAIVGFLGFTNVDTIKYRVASNSAGFSASVPAYEPAGFNLASVQSRSGYVGARYTGNIDGVNRSFAITQKSSSWNSDALRSSITASGDNVAVTTYEKGGRTIYVYGSNQAAWVSGGVLYQILGNGVLKDNDFVAIATSI